MVRCSSGPTRFGTVYLRSVSHSWSTLAFTLAASFAVRLARRGAEVELSGTTLVAGGGSLLMSARGTLVGRTVTGTGILNTRTGCPFNGERH